MSHVSDDYIVQPVMKALNVLDYVIRQGRDVTLTETVQELGLPKTTAFRYLQTLSAAAYLEYDAASDRYRAGPRFRALAGADRAFHALREAARPEMDALLDAFRETVNLAVLDNGMVVYIDIVDPGRSGRGQARVGHRHYLHSTSLGKAIAAFLPNAEKGLVGPSELPARTINTLTDARRFRREVEAVRARGFAVERGENEDGQMCIGVPILDAARHPLAAISLSAPETRMPAERIETTAAALKSAAARIARALETPVPPFAAS
ncbi:IclR family transcriptional regulator [Acuticoccus sp. M5D2P5]|uniref:IclR family transcriptional regulator n=1 Tax=Acuticoccus kalidii TaxID=2910977 RepID=UPI001F33CF30|nr:IclR family transcriptional regulator [Acuticoccus kalidii]MCF3934592.1 IclR family transcriptional regulator [Acuticoccus kalidii]